MPTNPGVTPERLAQMQQSGFTGSYYDSSGQLQQMNHGVTGAPTNAGAAGSAGAAGGNTNPPPTGATTDAQQNAGFNPQSGGPLNQWAPWMQSGGVNPTGWQSLGGSPSTGFLNMGAWSQGASDPGHATPTDPQSGFQSFIDNAYSQSERQLDPQWQQQQASFDQDMVNKGIAPGSPAYTQAKSQFDQSKNDAYSQARSQAQQQGLAAQGQAFGQGVQQSQLSGALAQALIGANSGYANQQLQGNSSLMNQLLGGNSAITQALIGADASKFGSTAAAGASRANSMNNFNLGMNQLNQQGQQYDFGNLMALLGMGQGVTQYNNGLLGTDQARNQSFFGNLPGGSGGNIDVQNPYNNQYNGQMNQYGINQANNNAQNQAYMSMISAMLCDRNAKEGCEAFRGSCTDIVRKLPVDRWRYKGQTEEHIGTYAQDFNKAAGLPDKPYINIIDMLGVVLGAVKELGDRMDRMELARAA